MRVDARSWFSLALLAAVASMAGAQPSAQSRDALVVSTSWLANHLKDPNLVVLFVGDDADYNKAHIPGSYNVQWEDFTVDDTTAKGLTLEVPPAAVLRKSLGSFGIGGDSRIIVSAGKNFLPVATRMILTLDYAGFGARTSLLDGGLPAWIGANGLVTTVVPAKHPGVLGAIDPRPVIVNADYVKAHLGKPGVSIVDGRASSFYEGAATGQDHAGPQRTGHIAGAKSVPFTTPYDDAGHVRPTEELRAIFAKAGVAPGDTVIGYCHIGQQATAMLFAARVLGHPVRLYDGSFQDWSRRPAAEYPVETSRGGGKAGR